MKNFIIFHEWVVFCIIHTHNIFFIYLSTDGYLGYILAITVKEESEKVGLKLNIQKTKIMASGPITSREIDGETVETVADFIFLGSKITADGDCTHEIKRCLLFGRKAVTNQTACSKVETLFCQQRSI